MFHQTSIRSVSFVAAVLFAAGVAVERAPAQDSDGVIVVEIQGDPKKAPPILSYVRHINLTVRGPVGKYLIGVSCFPVEGALRAQLNLAEGRGLVVDLVQPNQPAAKAGVKKYDVILAVDGAKVGVLKDLVAAIDKAKGNAITLHILRGGKKHTIGFTPVKRQQPAVIGLIEGKLIVPKLTDDVIKKLHIEGFEYKLDAKIHRHHLQFQAVRPGVFFGIRVAKLPKNLSVSITRSGEAPAKITVKQGDQTWEVTEKELDKLPKDVRGHVERMLGHSRPDHVIRRLTSVDFKTIVTPFKSAPVPPSVYRNDSVEKQLEQMRGEMREIRKALDELLKTRRKPRGKKARKE